MMDTNKIKQIVGNTKKHYKCHSALTVHLDFIKGVVAFFLFITGASWNSNIAFWKN